MPDLPIDPGAEPGRLTPKLKGHDGKALSQLEYLRGFISRHPDATLVKGEGKILLDALEAAEAQIVELRLPLVADDEAVVQSLNNAAYQSGVLVDDHLAASAREKARVRVLLHIRALRAQIKEAL